MRPLPRVLAAIGGIYVVQSVIGGITFNALPSILRSQGLPLEHIGLTFLAILPWSLKFIWAPAIERLRLPREGRDRSSVIVTTGVCLAAILLAFAALIGPAIFGALLAVLVLAAFASATVDIASDGFAVDTLAPSARGPGNAAQIGGAYLGSAVGSGLFLVLVARWGWTPSTLAMAALLLLLAVPFATMRRCPPLARAHVTSLVASIRRRDVRIGLSTTLFFAAGQKLAQGIHGPFLVDAGLGLGTLGIVNGVGGAIAGITGTVLAGIIVQRVGAPRVVCGAIVLQAAVMAAFALAAAFVVQRTGWLVVLALANSAVLALGYVALYAHLMSYASRKQAGVDFTLFQCTDATLAMVGGIAGAALARHAGYAACFALACAMATSAVLPLRRLISRNDHDT